MARRTTRARPLDLYRRILVQDDPGIVYDEDDSVPAPNKKNTIVALPTPGIQKVDTYNDEHRPDFVQPTSFVRWRPKLPGNANEVQYDLQYEDEFWLKKHPRWGAHADPRQRLAPEHFEVMLDLLEKETQKLGPGMDMSASQAVSLAQTYLRMYNMTMVEDVYRYWVSKRNRLHKPLMRRFWPATPMHDTNPHLVFRPREKERYKLRKHRKDDMDSYLKLVTLRNDLIRSRAIVRAVKQRELLKREVINVHTDVFEQEVHELTNPPGAPRASATLDRRADIRDRLYLKNLPRLRPAAPRADAPAMAHADDADKRARGRARQQQRTMRQPTQRRQVSAPRMAHMATGHRSSWWRAPEQYLGLPTATHTEVQDPMQLGVAMGLPVGLPLSAATDFDPYPGRAVSHSGLRPKVSIPVARNARATMGRLGFFGSRGWETQHNLATGVGGMGPFGEGWDSLGLRPEQRPPPVTEVLPDLSVIGFIRSRRADKHQEQQLNRLATSLQRTAAAAAAAAQAGTGTVDAARKAAVQAADAYAKAQAATAKNQAATAALRGATLLGGAKADGAGADAPAPAAPPAPTAAPTTPMSVRVPAAVSTPSQQFVGAPTPTAATPLGISTSLPMPAVTPPRAPSAAAADGKGSMPPPPVPAAAAGVANVDMDGGGGVGVDAPGVHVPGYYCRPRVGRGGRVIIDRVPMRHGDSYAHAAAWLALMERNRSRQLYEGKGSDTTSNRWAWQHPSSSARRRTDVLHPEGFESLEPFGPPGDLQPLVASADPWVSDAALPDYDSDDGVELEAAAGGDRGIPRPRMPPAGADVFQHMLATFAGDAGGGVPPPAASPPVFGVPPELSAAVSGGGAGSRLLAHPHHASWGPATHDGLPPPDTTARGYVAITASMYRDKRSDRLAAVEDKEDDVAATALGLYGAVATWDATDVDGLYGRF